MDLIEQDGVIKQRVGPGDVRPETLVVLPSEEGACGSITVMYLVNRPAELAKLLRAMPYVAPAASTECSPSSARTRPCARAARSSPGAGTLSRG